MRLLIICLFLSQQGYSQNPVNWTFTAVPSGKAVQLQLKARVHPGWHIYSQVQPADAIALPTKIAFVDNPLIKMVGKPLEQGKLEKRKDAVLGTEAFLYDGTITFTQQLMVKRPVKTNVAGSITYQVCTAEKCLPPRTVPFRIALP